MGDQVTIVGPRDSWAWHAKAAFANDLPLAFIAGPCQIEGEDHAFRHADHLKRLSESLGFHAVYKSSYDKANRTSLAGKRGVGMEKGLRILEGVRKRFDMPVTTDVHSPEDAYTASMSVDLLQIPAFLSRQTDLLVAAGHHGRAVSIKKMQSMAPWDMEHAVLKTAMNGQLPILIERGTSFGHGGLVVDMAGLPIMKQFGPVVFDATHSVQIKLEGGVSTMGNRASIEPLARAAVAVGIAGVFIEFHEEPALAPSDGASMVRMGDLGALIARLQAIDEVVKGFPS